MTTKVYYFVPKPIYETDKLIRQMNHFNQQQQANQALMRAIDLIEEIGITGYDDGIDEHGHYIEFYRSADAVQYKLLK